NLDGSRRVALVDGADLRLLSAATSTYHLVEQALSSGTRLVDLVHQRVTGSLLSYDAIYDGHSPFRILPPFDHPSEPARCHITGTGLTHRASVDNRNAMHALKTELTDSMRMYQSGLDGGHPSPGEIGVSPEWFYKGNGTALRAHGESLEVPDFAE